MSLVADSERLHNTTPPAHVDFWGENTEHEGLGEKPVRKTLCLVTLACVVYGYPPPHCVGSGNRRPEGNVLGEFNCGGYPAGYTCINSDLLARS